MDKQQQQQQQQQEQETKRPIWDCESSLYDSFELNSFRRALDSAIIASRTQSMQRMPSESTHVPHPPPQHQPKQQRRRRTSKLSRSLNRLVRMVFRQKPEVAAPFLFEQHHERGYEAYRRPGNLATIPEVAEKGGTDESPEIDALVRRTVSERFAGAVGISCA